MARLEKEEKNPKSPAKDSIVQNPPNRLLDKVS